MDVIKMIKDFDSEEKCISYLVARRWPKGPVCDKCGTVGHAFKLTDPRKWRCNACGADFSITAGTSLERTHLPLTIWFAAIWLIVASPRRVSVMVVSKRLGVSYKTAWLLKRRISTLLNEGDETVRCVGRMMRRAASAVSSTRTVRIKPAPVG